MTRESYRKPFIWSGSNIEWQNPEGPDVAINLNQVVVIGEYTTNGGPFFDDWFLVFVYKTGEWDSIPVYAETRSKILVLRTKKTSVNSL